MSSELKFSRTIQFPTRIPEWAFCGPEGVPGGRAEGVLEEPGGQVNGLFVNPSGIGPSFGQRVKLKRIYVQTV